jgi:hypothetical protein
MNRYGLDIGTMNIVMATTDGDEITTSSLRNLFLELDDSTINMRNIENISHVVVDDKVYILSEDAYTFANMFNLQVSRPMAKGMISPSEIDAIDVLGTMVKTLIGTAPSGDGVCCFSVPANPIDLDQNIIFHENVFSRIISQLGYEAVSLNEAIAIIYAECEDTDFTGLGISFGAGMTNIGVSFKSVPILNFSVARGGDWIDENAAISTGNVSSRVTLIKEREDFVINNFSIGPKKERRVREAIGHYYNNLIQYTTKNILNQLSKLDVTFPTKIPVIVSGGTSKAKGFLEQVKVILSEYEFPFEISEIRHASNPLTAVAEGCLIRSFKL